MTPLYLITQLNVLILFTVIILHVLHFRGPFTLPLLPFFRYFTRYERLLMQFLFKILKSETLFKNRLIRFIPEYISFIAANGARPTIYTLQELEHALDIIIEITLLLNMA